MFANLVDALQGPATEAVDDSPEQIESPRASDPAADAHDEAAAQQPSTSSQDAAGHAAEAQPAQQQSPAKAKQQQQEQGTFSWWGVASALADTVRKNTADIAASVKETDWRAELESFRQGVAQDAEAESKERKSVQMQRPRLPQLTPAQLQQLNQVGTWAGKFGSNVMSSTQKLFEQVQESINQELDGVDTYLNEKTDKKGSHSRAASRSTSRSAAGTKYSRLDSEVAAMQRNSSTYCDEPADADDFQAWLQGFDLQTRTADIEAIVAGNAFMAELQSRIVPVIVEHEDFWTRYFYQLHKLQEKHAKRQQVAQRAQRSATEEPAWEEEEAEAEAADQASPPAPQQAPSPGAHATPGTASSAVADVPEAKAAAKAADEDDDISDISDDDGAAAAAGGAGSEVDEDWGEDWE
ncbi:hypothetical protein WJX73_001726 [Symbiochloris irregularis]|uniref:BSD domain-containing protein n=1 Tax=Symbiochloris irregularis TaxID=706552 RepID=A0AAW1PC59_9CHLO